MNFLNFVLFLSYFSMNANGRNAAASISSQKNGECELKSRESSASVIARTNPELDLYKIHMLIKTGNIKDLELAVASGSIQSRSKSGISALHATIMFRERTMFDYLLAQECDVNGISAQFGTPLHHAAMIPHKEDGAYFMKALLENNADVNTPYNAPTPPSDGNGAPLYPSEEGYLAIQLAARYGNIVCVRLLVECGSPHEFTENKLSDLFASHVDKRRAEQSASSRITTLTTANAIEQGLKAKRQFLQKKKVSFDIADEFPAQSSSDCNVM